MAPQALTYGFVSIASNDLSAYCKGITLNVESEQLDSTAMSSSGYRSFIGGLKAGTLDLTFNQDVAAGLLDAIMWPLLGTVVAFEVRPTGAVVGTSNPKWTGSLLIAQWNPIAGSVGDLLEVSASFPTSGTVTRATA